MKWLIACEESAVVREAMEAMGHDAWSCDLAESAKPGKHYQCDVRDVLGLGWDGMIAHPPCDDLAVSGARWFKSKGWDRQKVALDFVRLLMGADIPKIVIENPVSIISRHIRKPDQIIQPWQFGEPAFKATCLWLKGLPLLVPTNMLTLPAKGTAEWKVWSACHRMAPGPNRRRDRARTYQGIANAMAAQWGNLT